MPTCKKCGATLYNDAIVCRKCGTPQAGGPGAFANPDEPPPPPGALRRSANKPKFSKVRVKQGLLWLLLLAAIGVAAGLLMRFMGGA